MTPVPRSSPRGKSLHDTARAAEALRTLITGAGGILGDALLRSAHFSDAVGVGHVGRGERIQERVDLRDQAAVQRLVTATQPDVVIQTVALTNVDTCQREPGAAYATSVLTTLHLAEALHSLDFDATLVYISSDQVYSGQGPHGEGVVAPLNVYGVVKHAGELAAARAPRHLVVRTNFVGHSRGDRQSYTDWLEAAARDNQRIGVHPEATFSALGLVQLVDLLAEMVGRKLLGTYNLGSRDGMRKIDFARSIAAAVNPEGASLVDVEEVVGSARAPRPLDLRLDVSRAEAALGRTLPSTTECLAEVVSELAERSSSGGS